MKKAFLALFFSAFFVSNTFGLELSITDLPTGDRVVNHNPDQWVKVTSAETYDVLIDKGIIGAKKSLVEFHSVTEFKGLQEYKGFPFKIKRIYTYGVMGCSNSSLMILVDIYADIDNMVRYTQSHRQGEYVVNMTDARIRRDIFGAVCGDSI